MIKSPTWQVSVILTAWMVPTAAPAAAPLGTAFTYQGRLRSAGAPLNATADLQFSLWDAAGSGSPPNGGNQIGSTLTFDGAGGNPPSVTVANGLFTVQLDFGVAAFTGDARWLQIAVRSPAGTGSYTTLSPRQAVTAAPYALSLAPGATVSGSSANGRTLQALNPAGNSIAFYGEASAAGAVAVYGKSDANTGVYGLTGIGRGVWGECSAGGVAVYGSASGLGAYGVVGEADATASIGVYGRSIHDIGVFGSSAGYHGVSGASTSNGSGVYGEAQWAGGKGVYGYNASINSTGVYGEANAAGGVGVYGKSDANTGVYGVSTSGNAVWGQSASGNGVFGHADSGEPWAGVRGESGDQFGIGVLGMANASDGYGVLGGSTSGHGVVGRRNGASLIDLSGYSKSAVWGDASSGTGVLGSAGANGAAGVVGVAPNNGTGVFGTGGAYAGYFNGLLYAVSASASVKAFRIDHPLDPANKYLQHSSVESPDMMNIYNGNVTTDANGDATVALPDYFEALNRHFRYQLTVIGQFAQAIVSKKIANNQFSIRTDKPSVEVSWQVTGIRQDPVANLHRTEVEPVKPEKERGKYLVPEAYGMPPDRAVNFPGENGFAPASTDSPSLEAPPVSDGAATPVADPPREP